MSEGLPNLLEQIGIDPQEFHWMQLSACRGLDNLDSEDGPFVNNFFENYEKDSVVRENIDQLCLTCPVTKECFEFGIRTKSTGVFGGFFLINGEVNKARNQHKTQEIAAKLASKVFDE